MSSFLFYAGLNICFDIWGRYDMAMIGDLSPLLKDHDPLQHKFRDFPPCFAQLFFDPGRHITNKCRKEVPSIEDLLHLNKKKVVHSYKECELRQGKRDQNPIIYSLFFHAPYANIHSISAFRHWNVWTFISWDLLLFEWEATFPYSIKRVFFCNSLAAKSVCKSCAKKHQWNGGGLK